MRLHHYFSRWVAPVPPVIKNPKILGTDVLPVDAAGAPRPPHLPNENVKQDPTYPIDDNVMVAAFKNIDGWPAHRLIALYKPPSGTGTVTAGAYVWEDELKLWIKLPQKLPAGTESFADATLTPGQPTFFDPCVLSDTVQTERHVRAGAPTRGSMSVLLLVAGTGPAGEHKFGLGADLTTSP
jgi:hypothetical protein